MLEPKERTDIPKSLIIYVAQIGFEFSQCPVACLRFGRAVMNKICCDLGSQFKGTFEYKRRDSVDVKSILGLHII